MFPRVCLATCLVAAIVGYATLCVVAFDDDEDDAA